MRGDKLTKTDKQTLISLSTEHLSGETQISLKMAMDSLKSLKDKFKDFWNEWLPAIGPGLKALLSQSIGENISDFSEYQRQEYKKVDSLKLQLELLISIAKKIDYKSLYILIDRVDESELSGNNVTASFELVSPLLKDLELLELKGIGFKFFLWDLLEIPYKKIARTDRIRQESLSWTDQMLEEMWRRRLLAYSGMKVSKVGTISDPTRPYTIDQLAIIFANGSPRDMIRIGDHIMREQQEINITSGKIQSSSVYRAIEKFCVLRSSEIVSDKTLKDLQKIRQVDFTIAHLSNFVFRENKNSSRSRIKRWRQEGAIVELDRIDEGDMEQTRPVKLFAISDIRVAKAINPDTDIEVFLTDKYRVCPSCKANLLRDWNTNDSSTRCHECQFNLDSSPDTWESWRRRDAASRTRRQYYTDQIYVQQMSLFDQESDIQDEESNDLE